jgi:hypothetical protein
MPELRQLHELTTQVRMPELKRLADLADRRRRRLVVGVTAGVAASVMVAAIAAGVVGGHDTTSEPVGPGPHPSPTAASPTAAFPALSPTQIRQHPDATVSSDADFPATASAVTARVWSVCLDECTRATEHLPGELQTALEVSNDSFATGALYELDRTDWISHAMDDWYLIEPFDGPLLVDSRGHRRALQVGAAVPITDVAGPLVYSAQGLAYLDMAQRQLHAIEGAGNWDWQGAGDTWFWGAATLWRGTTVTRQAAVWRRPDGTFAVKVLPIGDSRGSSGMLRAGTPGTMAVVEHFAQPRRAHISTDYGATWQIREVPAEVDSGGSLPAGWRTWQPG